MMTLFHSAVLFLIATLGPIAAATVPPKGPSLKKWVEAQPNRQKLIVDVVAPIYFALEQHGERAFGMIIKNLPDNKQEVTETKTSMRKLVDVLVKYGSDIGTFALSFVAYHRPAPSLFTHYYIVRSQMGILLIEANYFVYDEDVLFENFYCTSDFHTICDRLNGATVFGGSVDITINADEPDNQQGSTDKAQQ